MMMVKLNWHKRLWCLIVLGLISFGCVSQNAMAASKKKPTQDQQAPGLDADNPNKPKALEPEQKQFPTKVAWTLSALDTEKIDLGLNISFTVDGNYRASGFSGCNSWSATMYPLKNQRLATGPYAVTRKSCDKATNEREYRILSIFASGPNWDLVGDQLVVKGQQGTLYFTRSF